MDTAECQSAYDIARYLWMSEWEPDSPEQLADDFGIDIVLAAVALSLIRKWQQDAELAALQYPDGAIFV